MLSAVPESPLAEVAREFAEWRRTRTTLHTPDVLRRKALELLTRYRVSEVLNALNLSHKSLKRWQQILSPPPPPISAEVAFMPLSMPPLENASPTATSTKLTLTRQDGDGTSVSIEGELSREQWRWAVGLLREDHG